MAEPSPLAPYLQSQQPINNAMEPWTGAPHLIHRAMLQRWQPRLDPGYPMTVQWHPTVPILCTMKDVCWWDAAGSLITRCANGFGTWNDDGTAFWSVGRDVHHATTLAIWYDDFVTNSRITLPTAREWAFLVPHPYERRACIPLSSTHPPSKLGVWDGDTGIVHPLPETTWDYPLLRWSPNGLYLSGVTNDPVRHRRTGHLITRDGTILSSHPLPDETLRDVSWSPDSRWVIMHSTQHLLWWNVTTDRVRWFSMNGDIPSYEYLKWSGDGAWVGVVGNGAVLVFTADGELVQSLWAPDQRTIMNCAWHPTRHELMAGTLHGRLCWWDRTWSVVLDTPFTNPRLPQGGRGCGPMSLAWDSTGTLLAAGLYDRSVQLYALTASDH